MAPITEEETQKIQDQIDKFSRTLKVNPKHVVIRMKRAELYLKLKNYQKCMKDCRVVFAFEQFNIRCLLYTAACHLALGNKDEAIKFLVDANQFENCDDEYRYVLREFKEWDTAVFIEITDPEFIPEDKRCRNSYARPKTKPSYEDKYKKLFNAYNGFCMPPTKEN